MYFILGFLHLIISVVCIVTMPEELEIIWSQFLGGVLEIAIAFYFYVEHEEIV